MVGRKGWLFSDTVKGAIASANLFSIVETAKANGVETLLQWNVKATLAGTSHQVAERKNGHK